MKKTTLNYKINQWEKITLQKNEIKTNYMKHAII